MHKIAIIALCLAVTGCDQLGNLTQSSAVDEVKNSTLSQLDKSRTLETVFSHDRFYTSHTWSQETDPQGRKLVVMTGSVKWSGSNCSMYDDDGTLLAIEPCDVSGTEKVSFALAADKRSFELKSIHENLTATGGGKTKRTDDDIYDPASGLKMIYEGSTAAPFMMLD